MHTYDDANAILKIKHISYEMCIHAYKPTHLNLDDANAIFKIKHISYEMYIHACIPTHFEP